MKAFQCSRQRKIKKKRFDDYKCSPGVTEEEFMNEQIENEQKKELNLQKIIIQIRTDYKKKRGKRQLNIKTLSQWHKTG